MKNIIIVLLALFMVACSRVESGNVGIKVNLLGSDKGVQQEVLPPGRYYIGLNEELYIFPTYLQNCAWTKGVTGGSGCSESTGDEAIRFQTVDGMEVIADVGVSYTLDKERIPELFQKFRKGINEISDSYVRRVVQDAFIAQASTKQVDYVYGEGKAKLLEAVSEQVKEKLSADGILVDKVYLLASFEVPANVKVAINAKIEATQKAQQRENEVATAKAEAQKVIEEARGAAESVKLKAEAEAGAIAIVGKAIRENSQVVTLEAIKKWSGNYPQVMTGDKGAVPLIQIELQK